MKYIKTILVTLCFAFLQSCTQSNNVPHSVLINNLQQKADAGDLESQYQLGIQYTLKGRSESDFRRGYDWFLSAADRGHVEALYMVGMGKILGRGTAVDRKGAVAFFSKAAETGHARAQYQAGDAYLNGSGVEIDQAWGRQWLEQAARNDHEYAQFILAALFLDGIGGEKNLAEAWRWAREASRNGLERAEQALQNLEKKMSSEELAKGKRMLRSATQFDGELHRFPRTRYIQTVLNRLGYNAGDEDGLEGLRTRSAIDRFIMMNNLPRDIQTSDLIDFLRKYP